LQHAIEQGALQVGIAEIRAAQGGTDEFGFAEIRQRQIDVRQVSAA